MDPPQSRLPLRDRWRALRDRLLTSPRFHRWAAAFPPARPFARHESRALFDLVAGFAYSQVLAACVRLKLFEALADGPQTAAALARRLSLPLGTVKSRVRLAYQKIRSALEDLR